MSSLVATLADGPLDVIGDVHGELDALKELLCKLGYNAEGCHQDNRRLVFVGDLFDRGPDSPGVYDLVQPMVASGRAQMVLGNHELNLLLEEKKHGNHWFWGLEADPEHPEYGTCQALPAKRQDEIRTFLRTLPLALERPDLRVVHAAWTDEAIATCRDFRGDGAEAFRYFKTALEESPELATLILAKREEEQRLELTGDDGNPDARPALARYEAALQVGNPVRVLTSGIEQPTAIPFMAMGKKRWVERVPWWKHYNGEIPVLFGHYWRWFDPQIHPILSEGEPNLHDDRPPSTAIASHHKAFCVDFSVGARYKERHFELRDKFHGRLAAVRWPERTVVYDAEKPRSAFEIPNWLKTHVDGKRYQHWLARKARAHVKRDKRRGNPTASFVEYRAAIHRAVLYSRGNDAYTGEPLDWSKISTYDNETSKAAGRDYKKIKMARLPTVDHTDDGRGAPSFKICAWRTNDAKNDLTLAEFLELCQRVLDHAARGAPNVSKR